MKSIPTSLYMTMWLVLGAAGVLPAAAQPADTEEAPTFGEIVDVRVINLEVVVTDGKERVSGLASEDFRLLIDGQEVPIEYFTEVLGGVATEADAPAEMAAVPALQPGEAVGTRYLVFIDEVFSFPNQKSRILRHLADQLPHLGPHDHMAIVAFNGGQIDLLTSWTNSLPELERVLEEAKRRKSFGLYNAPSRFSAFDSAFAFDDPFFNDPFSFPTFGAFSGRYGTPRGSRSALQVDRVVNAATSVLRGFAKPPGRKVMLLYSGGWPIADWASLSTRFGYGGSGPDRRLYSPLIDTANRLGYTLYPVDMKGLDSRVSSAEFATLAEANFAVDLARERDWIEEGALYHLAEETGGRAFVDGAGLSALEKVAEDTRSYYWLGFTPTWQENDERHDVKVVVSQKGLKVRSRRSFSDLSRQTEVTMLVESSQLFDLPMPGEKADLVVTLGEPTKGGYRKVILPVRLEIPLDDVTLLPTRDGYAGKLELRIAATDDRGDRADIPVIPIAVRGEELEPGDSFVYEVGLKLRRRPHRLLLSLHDPASGTILSKRLDFSL